ncbi:expressed unknown protein [Seminavis robusta]|uniref:Uncharacterized protein n=1 Tax=Seminavis robusta TaxID=568900 RepID=A0A9N8H7Z8_9STRA|nr:expressed unknown protein [Seminavis robusta]|eukprot:Sro155_g070360.1 n/a (300) ;mRNA; r:24586-25485
MAPSTDTGSKDIRDLIRGRASDLQVESYEALAHTSHGLIEAEKALKKPIEVLRNGKASKEERTAEADGLSWVLAFLNDRAGHVQLHAEILCPTPGIIYSLANGTAASNRKQHQQHKKKASASSSMLKKSYPHLNPTRARVPTKTAKPTSAANKTSKERLLESRIESAVAVCNMKDGLKAAAQQLKTAMDVLDDHKARKIKRMLAIDGLMEAQAFVGQCWVDLDKHITVIAPSCYMRSGYARVATARRNGAYLKNKDDDPDHLQFIMAMMSSINDDGRAARAHWYGLHSEASAQRKGGTP